MKIDDIRNVAESFIAAHDMRGHTLKFVETKDSWIHPNEWSVIFDVYSPSRNLIDGPIIVIVDKETLKAHFFESP